jgi:hypothetical protein
MFSSFPWKLGRADAHPFSSDQNEVAEKNI